MMAYSLGQMSFQLYLIQQMKRLVTWLKGLARIFLDWMKLVWNLISKGVLKSVSRLTFVRYYEYENISLKLFVEIVNTGKYHKLARSKFYDIEKCYYIWEQVLTTNSTMEGSNKMGITLDSFKAYLRYSTHFVYVNAMLTKLQFIVDREAAEDLTSMGYKIDLTSSESYARSIKSAFSKLKNINNKINSKQVELEAIINSSVNHKSLDFGEMVAFASAGLGFQIGRDVTLSEYNSYMKLLKHKQK